MRIASIVTVCLAAPFLISACLDSAVTGPPAAAGPAGAADAAADSTVHPDTTTNPGTDTTTNPRIDTTTNPGTDTTRNPGLRGIPPTLFAPDSGARIRQNDSTIGCPYHQFRGHGFEIRFDWSDVERSGGTAGYHLFVKKVTAQYPVFDGFVGTSELVFTQCNAFVIDRNLEGWEWKVRAVDSAGAMGVWSESRSFSFAPCRHADGASCMAPPGS
jgi:hypothetical protein